ncbi:MAG TPA: hypothetical protein VKA34_06880 [Balneolales bacterium]|nr:hypothetical protein [Balneolales bacterium]
MKQKTIYIIFFFLMIALGGCQKIDGSQNYISTGIQGRVYNIGSPAEPVG